MARMNISIPDSLKDEMDELSSVNWSALAAEVFGREVRKSRKVDAMNTEQVVERLRASYEYHTLNDDEKGNLLGVDWAAKEAEYGELFWIAETHNAAERLHAWRRTDIEGSAFDEWTPEVFWEIVGGDAHPSKAFVRGFVYGALEVWEKVKDQVRD